MSLKNLLRLARLIARRERVFLIWTDAEGWTVL
jgi:hypothetical protein